MRIIHVIHTLDASDGGPPVVAASLAIAQARLGADVHLLAYAHGPDNLDGRGVLSKLPDADRIKLHTVDLSRFERLTMRRVRRKLGELLPSTDVVHLHGVWVPTSPFCAKVCVRAGIPYVLQPHGSLAEWALAEKALKKRVALRLYYGRMLRRAAWLHVTSEYEAEGVIKERLNDHVKIIPPGVEDELLKAHPHPGAFARRFPVVAGCRYVLFLARLHPGKGAEILVEAMAHLRRRGCDLHAVIAGPDAGIRAGLQQQIERLGVRDRVHLVGPVYGEAKVEALCDAMAFCLPSMGESFGMSIAEAMAVGTPVVVSPECHFNAVTDAGAGLVVPRSPERVADALQRMADDEAFRRGCADAGRALANEKYTWPAAASRTFDAYRSIAKPAR
ncbi:MAG: glycosyltransferase [Phycisphaerales bacterium]